MNVNELFASLKDDESLMVSQEDKWVAVLKEQKGDSEQEKTSRLYKIEKGGELVEVNFVDMKKKIIDTIMSKINVNALVTLLLNERFDIGHPSDFFEVVKRLQNPKAKIVEKKGCVEISIGGLKGSPFPLRLV